MIAQPTPPARRGVILFFLVSALAAVALYTAVFSIKSIYIHQSFGTSAYDIGLADQAIWLLSEGKVPFSTIKGVHRFGDHATLYDALLLAPLYWIYPTINHLFITQSLLLALGGLPLFFFARKRLQSSLLAFAVLISFLLHPAVQNMNLENFHSEALSVLFLMLFLYALLTGKTKLSYVAALLSAMGKEDIGITVAWFGIIFALWKREWRVGATISGIGIGWYLLASRVIMPTALGIDITSTTQPVVYSYWFQNLNLFSWSFYQERIFSDKALGYAQDLLQPVSYLSLAGGPTVLFALPSFMINCFTGNGYMMSVQYHYNYCVLPGIFFALVEACALIMKLVSRPVLQKITALVVTCLLGYAAVQANLQLSLLNVTKYRSILSTGTEPPHSPGQRARFHALSLIPKDAKISASHSLVPHLTHREHIYMFPNTFQGRLWNMWFQEDQDLPNPLETVDYVLLDLHAHDKNDDPLIQAIRQSPTFKQTFEDGSIVLLERQRAVREPGQGAAFKLFTSDDHAKSTTIKTGTLSSLFFPTSSYRFRNILGEEIAAKAPYAIEIEGSVLIDGFEPQILKLDCQGSCLISINGGEFVPYTKVTPGVYRYLIRYKTLSTSKGLKLFTIAPSGKVSPVAETALWNPQNEEEERALLERAQRLREQQPPSSVELLYDGDFEVSGPGTNSFSFWRPTAWQESPGNSRLSVRTNGCKSAHRCARIENAGNADSRFVQDLRLPAGRKYKVSGWIRTENIPTDAVSGGYIAVEGAEFSLRTQLLRGTNDWSYFESSGMISAFSEDPLPVSVVCRLGDYGAPTTGTVWCDRLSLIAVNEAQAP